MSIARITPIVGSLYGLMRNALGLNVETPLGAQELSCTISPDRRLVVLGTTPIAGFAVDHGTVADEAAMLALHTLDSATLIVAPTFVAPGDSCLRTDDPGWRWHCIAGHGTTLADWERRPLGGALAGLAVSGHTHTISGVTGLQTALDGKQAALPDADALARISAIPGGPILWDGSAIAGGGEGSSYVGSFASLSTLLSGAYPVGSYAQVEDDPRLYFAAATPTTAIASWRRVATTVATLGDPLWVRLNVTASPGDYVELIALRYRIGGEWYPQVPMSSDTTPSPLVASGTPLLSGYPAYLAFDGDPGTRVHTSGALPCSITVYLGEVDVSLLTAVGITPGWYSADRVPRDFTVQTSATGAFAGEQAIAYAATAQTYTTSTERIFEW